MRRRPIHLFLSLRTLCLATFFICAYCGLWRVTEDWALRTPSNVRERNDEDRIIMYDTGVLAPFVFWESEYRPPTRYLGREHDAWRCYYLWMFGVRVKVYEYDLIPVPRW